MSTIIGRQHLLPAVNGHCREASGWIGMLDWLIEVTGVNWKKNQKKMFCYESELFFLIRH